MDNVRKLFSEKRHCVLLEFLKSGGKFHLLKDL